MAKVLTAVEFEHSELVTLVTQKAREASGIKEGSVTVRFVGELRDSHEDSSKLKAIAEFHSNGPIKR